MYDLNIKQLHAIVGGRLRLATLAPLHGEAAPVGPIASDSRQVDEGQVFWALNGKRFNGVSFANDAYDRGATGIVAEKYVPPAAGCWSLEVEDSLQSLVGLAQWNRRRMCGQLIGVTGSVGKTTTRQMIHAVLTTQFTGTASPKNYNNHIGVPLSMLTIDPTHDFALLELAASGTGEIGALARLCGPTIGVITDVGDAHLGGFGSLDAVAQAKTELLVHLPANGHAVLNGDNPRLRRLAERSRAPITWFGRLLENDLVAANITCGGGELSFDVAGQRVKVRAWGRHHLSCALAAVAVGRIFGLSDSQIASGLAEFEPAPMRCQITQVGETTVIDDSYNASPMAMKAALELLRDFDAPGRRVVVCGDMRELGDAAGPMHRELGDQVVTVCGADLLVACGEHAGDVVAGALAAGMPSTRAVACRGPEDVWQLDIAAFEPGDVVLVKGSRAMAMERVVATLHGRDAQAA